MVCSELDNNNFVSDVFIVLIPETHTKYLVLLESTGSLAFVNRCLTYIGEYRKLITCKVPVTSK